MNRRDEENELVSQANEAYRARRPADEIPEEPMQPCSCGMADCPGHGKRFDPYRLKESTWEEVVSGIKRMNPDAEVGLPKRRFFGARPYTGAGSIHPDCAEKAIGRKLKQNDFVKRRDL